MMITIFYKKELFHVFRFDTEPQDIHARFFLHKNANVIMEYNTINGVAIVKNKPPFNDSCSVLSSSELQNLIDNQVWIEISPILFKQLPEITTQSYSVDNKEDLLNIGLALLGVWGSSS